MEEMGPNVRLFGIGDDVIGGVAIVGAPETLHGVLKGNGGRLPDTQVRLGVRYHLKGRVQIS